MNRTKLTMRRAALAVLVLLATGPAERTVATTPPAAPPVPSAAPSPATAAPTAPPPPETDPPATAPTSAPTTPPTGPVDTMPGDTVPGGGTPGDSVPGDTTVGSEPAAPELPDTRQLVPITFPVAGPVSYGNGWNDCRDDCTRRHIGTDIIGDRLQPLLAMHDGVIDHLTIDDPMAGNGVTIVDAAGWKYQVFHMNNDSLGTDNGADPTRWRFAPGIGPGVRVQAGQFIGWMGDSGNAEYSVPHTHVEIHAPDGTPINPFWSLVEAQRDVACSTTIGEQVLRAHDLGVESWNSVLPDGWQPLTVNGGQSGRSASFLISPDGYIPVTTAALAVGDPSFDSSGCGGGAGWSLQDTSKVCRDGILAISATELEVRKAHRYAVTSSGRVVVARPDNWVNDGCGEVRIAPTLRPTTITHYDAVVDRQPSDASGTDTP